MDSLGFLFHDPVVRASASTYNLNELARLGLKMDLNLTSQKNRFVGDPPIYPEIVIWRPDYQGANTGQAVIVEAIETNNTINNPGAVDKWRRLAALGITFNLIVPIASQAQIRQILNSQAITNVTLQVYNYDQNNRYVFTTVTR